MLTDEDFPEFRHINGVRIWQNEDDDSDTRDWNLVVYLPGVLATDAVEQIQPLLPVLRHHDILCLSYKGSTCDANLIFDIADAIAYQGEGYNSITLVGNSLGGLYLPWVVDALAVWLDYSKLRILALDSPSGLSDIYGLVNRMGARLLAPWLPAKEPVRKVFNQLMQPPKRANIAKWSPDIDYHYLGHTPQNQKDYENLVIERALERLHAAMATPELLQRYLNQLTWIAKHAKDTPWEVLRNIPTTYVACTSSGNTTIRQPSAAVAWQKLTGCETRKIPIGAHTAFLEQPGLWCNVLDSVLRDLLQTALCKVRAAPLRSRPLSFYDCRSIDKHIIIYYNIKVSLQPEGGSPCRFLNRLETVGILSRPRSLHRKCAISCTTTKRTACKLTIRYMVAFSRTIMRKSALPTSSFFAMSVAKPGSRLRLQSSRKARRIYFLSLITHSIRVKPAPRS